MRIGKAVLLLLPAALGGCSFTPGPRAPAPWETLPEAFSEAEVQGEYQTYAWWTSFQDPILDRFVASVGLSYQFDSWGRSRNDRRASVADLQASAFPPVNARQMNVTDERVEGRWLST
ncbi:hypothetical protein ACFL3S_00310 [Gemmatimonadota bacterium]